MTKRLVLLLALGIIPVFSQTPCIEQAKKGEIGTCLNIRVPVTEADAKFVPVVAMPNYVVYPQLPYSLQLEFSTKEQALAIVELVKFAAPGSKLVVKDVGSGQSFPPFRELVYYNDGGLFAPRLYEISGTIPTVNGNQPTTFEPGWFINVYRLLYGGSYTGNQFPFGKDRVVVMEENGGAYPKWVGSLVQ